MSATVSQATNDPQVNRLDLRPRMAKAQVKNLDPRREIGKAITIARSTVGWTQKEFADAVKRDQALVARWESGTDRPPFDVLLMQPVLGVELVKQLARIVPDADVEETVTIRRRA